MATLNNKKIKDTFKGLLKTLDNAEITGQVEITDGDGNQTGVFINTDGSIKVTGTAEFGSLKDTGEDITITKFVDEADGISNNDDDSSIPTSAAVKDYVDSGVNTNAANISTNTSNISTNTSDISTNTSAIALNTAKNSYPSADAAKVANISVTQAVDLDTLESNVATNNSKVSFDSASSSKLSGIEAGAQVNDVTSVNGQTGSVTLTSSNVNEGTNLYYTDSRVAANSAVAANTLKNTYPSADATKVGHITVTQAVDLDTLESNVATNNAKISFDSTSSTKLSGIESGAEVNPTSTDELSEGSTNLYYTDARVSSNSAVAANTAKTGITTQQAADIVTNNAKVGITTTQADAITANSAKISFDSASSTKLAGIETNADVTDVANVTTALNSIDIQELSNVSSTNPTNNQVLQFSDTTNKFEPTTLTSTAPVDSVNTQTGAVVLDTDDIDEGTSNLYYTEARVSANTNVAANTLKNSYPSADATKVGFISVTQAVDLDTIESDVATNNAKVGITTQQANDITTNNAKISFDGASSTKLAGIEENADVTDTANVTAAGALMDSEVDADIKTLSLPANTTISSFAQSFLDDADAATVRATIGAGTSDFDGSYSSLTGTPTIPTNNNELANGAGYITDGNTGWDNSYGFITASSTDTLTNKSGSNNQWTNDAGYTTNVGTVTEVTVGTALGVTSGTSTPNITLDTANLYKVIGIATDHASRVTLDNGTSEGATSIMQNFETLIFN